MIIIDISDISDISDPMGFKISPKKYGTCERLFFQIVS